MKKTIVTLLLIHFIFSLSSFAQKTQKDVFKALFLYNFAKNIEWPQTYKKGDFIVGVLGNSTIIPELNKIAKKKKIGSQSIVVKRFTAVDKIGKCHVLFIPSNKNSSIDKVLKQTAKKPVLILTDSPNMVKKGALINFVMLNGAQKFEISSVNFKSRGLKVSSFLLKLGIKVD